MDSVKDIWYKTIATSFLSGELTFFMGTGFSKQMTDNKAPSWLELLFKVAINVGGKGKESLVSELFILEANGVKEANYDLFICAQMIENYCVHNELIFRDEIAEVISETTSKNSILEEELEDIKEVFREFDDEGKNSINIITTNYDNILSEFIFEGHANTFCEERYNRMKLVGYPNIYHIHGMNSYPSSIIITMSDYFKFQSFNSYLTRKLYNLVEESIVVILGYSLNDFNINKIFNDVNESKNKYTDKKEIFYVVRERVPKQVKAYYLSCYGINVIDNTEINAFFELVLKEKEAAKKIMESAEDTRKVIDAEREFEDDYLKIYNTFSDILVRVVAIGKSLNEPSVINMLLNQLEKKRAFTEEEGAFIQYESLALWLGQFIDDIMIDELKDNENDRFEELIVFSFSKMSEKYQYGFSWNAHKIWRNNWNSISHDKQKFIKQIIAENKNRFTEVNGITSIIGCSIQELEIV